MQRESFFGCAFLHNAGQQDALCLKARRKRQKRRKKEARKNQEKTKKKQGRTRDFFYLPLSFS